MTKGQRGNGTVSPAITPDTIMADLMERWPASRVVLARRGMACVGCAMAPFETVAEVAEAYRFDAAELLREIAAQVPTSAPRHAALRRRKDMASRPMRPSTALTRSSSLSST